MIMTTWTRSTSITSLTMSNGNKSLADELVLFCHESASTLSVQRPKKDGPL